MYACVCDIVRVYRIAGNFREVKNSFNSKNGGFREYKFRLVLWLHYLPVSHAYVKISWRYVSLPTKILPHENYPLYGKN